MKWEWKGNKLAPPQQIVRRLIAWPFAQTARLLFVAAVLVGWGLRDAQRAWDNTW